MKARFANDMLRVKVLAKNGHKDIDIIELKNPMTKTEAVEFLLSINFDNGNAKVRAALEAEVSKRTGTKTVSAKKPAKSKPSMDALKAKAKAVKAKAAVKETVVTRAEVDAQLEDAPF
jgi:hypothetical protein